MYIFSSSLIPITAVKMYFKTRKLYVHETFENLVSSSNSEKFCATNQMNWLIDTTLKFCNLWKIQIA